jgi:hypothetical protein
VTGRYGSQGAFKCPEAVSTRWDRIERDGRLRDEQHFGPELLACSVLRRVGERSACSQHGCHCCWTIDVLASIWHEPLPLQTAGI